MQKASIRLTARGVIVRNAAILLVEYLDENGLHYNIPGGGVEFGEPLRTAVQREVMEETCVSATAHDLLFVYEHVTPQSPNAHSVSCFFRCTLAPDAIAKMPLKPDLHQTGVKWIPLTEFADILLYPHVNQHILDALSNTRLDNFIETIPLR